jgi:hypothetical protein
VAALLLSGTVLALVRLLSLGLRPGHSPVRSRVGFQAWATLRLLDQARTWLFPLYSSLLTPVWLRLLGARVGRGVEASTVLLLPSLTTVGDGAFLADDTMVGAYELNGGWLRVESTKIGKRAFLGNSGMTAPGRRVRKHGLVAVLSAAPERAKPGSSWLGSPPVRLRRSERAGDESRTFSPPRRLWWRAPSSRRRPWCRWCSHGALLSAVLVATRRGRGLRGLACPRRCVCRSGPAWPPCRGRSAGHAAKGLLVGRRSRAGEPRCESRSSGATSWPTRRRGARRSVVQTWGLGDRRCLPLWLRSLGRVSRPRRVVRVVLAAGGRPGALGDGATVERRVRAADAPVPRPGAQHRAGRRRCRRDRRPARGGPAGRRRRLGRDRRPASLVVRGDHLPQATRWLGNPVAPWHAA